MEKSSSSAFKNGFGISANRSSVRRGCGARPKSGFSWFILRISSRTSFEIAWPGIEIRNATAVREQR